MRVISLRDLWAGEVPWEVDSCNCICCLKVTFINFMLLLCIVGVNSCWRITRNCVHFAKLENECGVLRFALSSGQRHNNGRTE